MPQLQLCYYGDDFTGSTDALESLVTGGVRTRLFIEPPSPEQLAQGPDLQAIGVAGRSRSLAPQAMAAELQPVFAALRRLQPRHVHYKVCSTFDSAPHVGSIGRALEIGADVFGSRFVPIVAGTPALGRYCVFGNLYARMGIGSAGAIHRLDRHPAMSSHPTTPMHEADLIRHLAAQTSRSIGLIDVLTLALPLDEARAKLSTLLNQHCVAVLFDALTDQHLHRVGELLDELATVDRPLFTIGSSAVGMALAPLLNAELRAPHVQPLPPLQTPALIASGSCSPVTAGQIEHALSASFVEVPLYAERLLDDATAPGEISRAADLAVRQLQLGRHVILHTSRGPDDPRRQTVLQAALIQPELTTSDQLAARLGTALGTIVLRTGTQASVQRVCVAGGDTSSYAAQAMGIETLEMLAPLVRGAPLCRATAPAWPAGALEVVFKGGQVGAPDFFERLVNAP